MVNYYLCLNNLKNIPLNTKELEKIDEFTKEFNNEQELKLYLFEKGIITKNDIMYDIVIKYKYKKINTIKVVYKDDYKYLDPIYLRYYLKSKKEDKMIFKKIYNHLYYNKSQEENLNALRFFIGTNYCNDQIIDGAIDRIIAKESKRYKALRDIALLVKEEKKKEIKKGKQLSFFDKKSR